MYITAAICGLVSENKHDKITVKVTTTQNNVIKIISTFLVNGLLL